MIQRLTAPAITFKANSSVIGVKDAYESKVAQNSKIAEEQNSMLGLTTNTQKTNNNISMQGGQGVGEKLNIIA